MSVIKIVPSFPSYEEPRYEENSQELKMSVTT